MLRYIFVISAMCFSIISYGQPPDLELARLRLEKEYDEVGWFDPQTLIATINKDQKMGYADINGKVILPLGEYTTCRFSDGVGVYYKYDRASQSYTHYLIDKNGKLLKTFTGFYILQKFERGLAVARKMKGDYYGLMTREGIFKVPMRYRHIERLNSKYFIASDSSGKHGLIDSKGKTIIAHKFGMVLHIDTVALKIWAYDRDLKNYGVFDAAGKLVKSFPFSNVDIKSYSLYGQPYWCHDGLIILQDKKTKQQAVVNLDFEVIVPFGGKYLEITDINDGRIKVATDFESEKLNESVTRSYIAASGFLDYSGKVVIAPEKRSTQYFNEGLCPVTKDRQYGYMDKDGKIVIPFQFDYATTFHDGYARVNIGNRYYIIDKTGKIVSDYKKF